MKSSKLAKIDHQSILKIYLITLEARGKKLKGKIKKKGDIISYPKPKTFCKEEPCPVPAFMSLNEW